MALCTCQKYLLSPTAGVIDPAPVSVSQGHPSRGVVIVASHKGHMERDGKEVYTTGSAGSEEVWASSRSRNSAVFAQGSTRRGQGPQQGLRLQTLE